MENVTKIRSQDLVIKIFSFNLSYYKDIVTWFTVEIFRLFFIIDADTHRLEALA